MDEDEASTSTPIIESYFIHKPHVLLIDDHAYELEDTAYMFEHNSWRVTKSSTTMGALGILKNKKRYPNKMPKIDMVCMKVSNREIKEADANKRLLAIKRAPEDVPVVILTNKPLYPNAWNKFEEAGAVACMTKPVNRHTLNNLLSFMDWEPYDVMEIEEKDKKKKNKRKRDQNLKSNVPTKKTRTLNLG